MCAVICRDFEVRSFWSNLQTYPETEIPRISSGGFHVPGMSACWGCSGFTEMSDACRDLDKDYFMLSLGHLLRQTMKANYTHVSGLSWKNNTAAGKKGALPRSSICLWLWALPLPISHYVWLSHATYLSLHLEEYTFIHPGTVPGTGDAEVNKTSKECLLSSSYSNQGYKQIKNVTLNSNESYQGNEIGHGIESNGRV